MGNHARRRPGRRTIRSFAATVVAALVTGLCIGIFVIAEPRYVAVCGKGPSACVTAIAATEPVSSTDFDLQIVPLGAESDGRVTVKNYNAVGATVVGVVGYFSEELSRAVSSTFTPASKGLEIAVELAARGSQTIKLTGAPSTARSVLLQIGGTTGHSATTTATKACTASDTDSTVCRLAQVFFTSSDGPITRQQVQRALERRAAATFTPAPSSTAVDAVVRAITRDTTQPQAPTMIPAKLAVTATPGEASATLTWTVEAGDEEVTKVVVGRDGTDSTGAASPEYEEAGRSGSRVFEGLTPGTLYTLSATLVVNGQRVTPLQVQVTPTAPAQETPPVQKIPAPAPAPYASVTSSGETMPVGDLPGWRQFLTQDFTRDAALGEFTAKYPAFSGYDGVTDTSREEGRPLAQQGLWNNTTTSSVHDGLYDCYLHTEGETPQVCALTPSPDGNWWEGQLYGRYSVRFSIDAVQDYKIAWLLWPSSDNWDQGEIDFPEGDLDGQIFGSSHNVLGDPGDNQWFIETGVPMSSGWHTATIEWKPGSLTFILDGESWTTTDPAALPKYPMRWALQAETQISPVPPPKSAAGHIYIDWLAGWSYIG